MNGPFSFARAFTNFVNATGGLSIWGPVVLLGTLVFFSTPAHPAGLALLNDATEDTQTLPDRHDCINNMKATGAVMGEAVFTGEPWIFSWMIDSVWDNDAGQSIKITPISVVLQVPGEATEITFSDGTTYRYGVDIVTGDNLGGRTICTA